MGEKYQYKMNFNLEEQRPQVLLLGNGLLLNDGKPKWDEVIEAMSSAILCSEFSKDEEIPYSIKASVMVPADDQGRRRAYAEYFSSDRYNHHMKDPALMRSVLDLGFDAILTTNYTYEIENTLHNGFSELKKKNVYAISTEEKLDSKYLMHTFNQLTDSKGRKQNIWHIHGEVRNKSSIILTHEEYSRVIGKMMFHNTGRGNDYVRFLNSYTIKSWVDFFLAADIYILGFGFDFSEFDLWWLLNRRSRERGKCGTIYFFDPERPGGRRKSIQKTLQKMSVKVENCEMTAPASKEKEYDYPLFYSRAIKKIAELKR